MAAPTAIITGEITAEKVSNSFSLEIKDLNDAIQKKLGKTLDLYLDCFLGNNADCLFQTGRTADKCKKTVPSGWTAEWKSIKGDPPQYRLRIYRKATGTTSTTLTIGFTEVKSETLPGEAKLKFSTNVEGLGSQDLAIRKTESEPSIISFSSDPPEDVTKFANQELTLTWCTTGIARVELKQNGAPAKTENGEELNLNPEKDSYAAPWLNADAKFELFGYDPNNRELDHRTLTARVRRAGWYKNENMHDNKLYAPVELIVAGDRIYAVFRDPHGQHKARLFETDNPFTPWRFVCDVPDSCSDRPGLYFDDTIWFIGGSQIDPARCSNEIWYLNPTAVPKTFRRCGADDTIWNNKKRMGHGVLLHGDEIWVMGGYDEYGNALDDLWKGALTTADSGDADLKWQQKAPLKNALGMIRPAVFDNKIWLFGGATQPFADDSGLLDDLYCYDFSTNQWSTLVKPKDPVGAPGKPIASCLQVFHGNLQLFRFNRSTTPVRQVLAPENISANQWTEYPAENLGVDWIHYIQTFSLHAVSLQGRMLIVRALGYNYDTGASQVKVWVE